MLNVDSEYDVAIVGAGPAGSSAAIRFALDGQRVLLVEAKRFPREKLCGEFISPECLEYFAELGITEMMSAAGGVELVRTVFYSRSGRSVEVPSEWFGGASNALGLSRAEMDRLLLERARDLGVDVREENHASALSDNGSVIGVRLKSGDARTVEIRAELTIDATGRSRVLARQTEKERGSVSHSRSPFVAFKTHLVDADVPDNDCEIYAYSGGYGGASRVENGRHNLCFIVKSETAKKYRSDAERVMREHVFANQRAKDSLENARVIEPWLAVPIASYGRFDLAPLSGLLTIGDAAAFIDPFTGSGILMALRSAKIVADAILNNRTSSFAEIAAEYKRSHAAAFARRLRISSILRHAAYRPMLAESVIFLLSKSSFARHRLAMATRSAG